MSTRKKYKLQFSVQLAATPPSAPAFMRGLAKLPILGNFDWGSPNILPPASFHSATPRASAGGKGCGVHFKQSDKLKFESSL